MKLNDIVNSIEGEFDINIDNIRLINNTVEPIPELILDREIKKITTDNNILTIYL